MSKYDTLYDFLKHQNIENPGYERHLLTHILRGDTVDEIPTIFSHLTPKTVPIREEDIDTFKEIKIGTEEQQNDRLTDFIAKKFKLNVKIVVDEMVRKVVENYKRNKQLID